MHIYMYIHTIDWENFAILTPEKILHSDDQAAQKSNPPSEVNI